MILLYASDPGGINFLAPLAQKISEKTHNYIFLASSQLKKYALDRQINCAFIDPLINADNLLKNVKLLIVGTSDNNQNFEHDLTTSAKRKNIPSIGVVDIKVNFNNRFKGRGNNPLKYAPDWLVVTDECMAKAYISIGFPSDRLLIFGHPHYDQVRRKRYEFQGEDSGISRNSIYPSVPKDIPIWLFIAESKDYLNPKESFINSEYTLLGRGRSKFRTLIALEEVLDVASKLNPRPWIVLRLHPKSSESDFITILPEIDMISRVGDPLPLIWYADLILGMTSMLLIESYLLGKPHLAILTREIEKTWLYTLEKELTKAVYTKDQLGKVLNLKSDELIPTGDNLPREAAHKFIIFLEKNNYV